MRIPKSFTLLNRTWAVVVVTQDEMETYIDEHDMRIDCESVQLKGLCDPNTNMILINADEHKRESDIEHTFWHEFGHAFRFAQGHFMQEHDETQIDLEAGLLHQFMQTWGK